MITYFVPVFRQLSPLNRKVHKISIQSIFYVLHKLILIKVAHFFENLLTNVITELALCWPSVTPITKSSCVRSVVTTQCRELNITTLALPQIA
jgi:hypothetical protein